MSRNDTLTTKDMMVPFYFLFKNFMIFRIDSKVLKDLILFGYTEKNASKALIQSNNNFNLALDV